MEKTIFIQIIQQICCKHKIHCTLFDDGLAIKMKKNSQCYFIYRKNFGINTSSSARIADDKYLTYSILASAGLPAVLCCRIDTPLSDRYYKTKATNLWQCEQLLLLYPEIVIKPNNASEGRDVYRCKTPKEAETVLAQLNKRYKNLVVSPYIESLAEYRIFCLKGKALFAYRKYIPLTLDSEESLWKYNLSQGALPAPLDAKTDITKLYSLAENAVEILQLDFATVDILEKPDGSFVILEINGGVAMDHFMKQYPDGEKIDFEIYEKAILSMFS